MSITRIARSRVIGVGLACLLPMPVHSENFARGQALYEHHCNACHSNLAFGGKDRKVTSPDELRGRIAAWAAHAGEEWDKSEIDDVMYYLDRSFYHFMDKDT